MHINMCFLIFSAHHIKLITHARKFFHSQHHKPPEHMIKNPFLKTQSPQQLNHCFYSSLLWSATSCIFNYIIRDHIHQPITYHTFYLTTLKRFSLILFYSSKHGTGRNMPQFRPSQMTGEKKKCLSNDNFTPHTIHSSLSFFF